MSKRAKLLHWLLIFTLVISFSILPTFTNSDIAKADGEGWLSDWLYRVSKTITAAGEAVANFTVTGGMAAPLNLHWGNGTSDSDDLYFNEKCKYYFDDIRVTEDDGGTEIEDYYIRNCTQTTGELCVLLDVTTSSQTIYIYYGNSSATRKSDVFSTFPLGSDFEREGNVLYTGTPTGSSGDYNAWPGICRLHDGTLFACWAAGSAHIANDHNLYYSYSTNGGRTWATPIEFVDDASYSVETCMPSEFLFNGIWTIVVSYQKVNWSSTYDSNRKAHCIKATNYIGNWGSETWGSEITIAGTGNNEDARGIRCKIIEASDGNHYVATYCAYSNKTLQIQKSTDDCATWAETEIESGDSTNGVSEPSVVEIKDGGIYNGDFYVMCRCSAGGNKRKYLSTDYGATWGSSASTGISESDNGDSHDMIRMSNGDVVVAVTSRDASDDGEIRLYKQSSEDEDITWDTTNYSLPWRYRDALIYTHHAYPSICEIEDGGQIGMTFYMGSDGDTDLQFYYVPIGSFCGNYFEYASTAKITYVGSASWNTDVRLNEFVASNNMSGKSCSVSSAKYWVEARIYTTSKSTNDQNAIYLCDGNAITHRLGGLLIPNRNDQNDVYTLDGGSLVKLTSDDFAEGTTYRYSMYSDEDGNTVSYYMYNDSNTLLYSDTGCTYYSGTPTDMDYILIGSSSTVGTAYSNWYGIYLRKYSSTEPQWSTTGSEEYWLSIDLDITTWNVGVLAISETANTGLDYFTVTNDGGFTVDIAISGTDMTGISVTWTLSDTATVGDATYGLKAGLVGTSYNIIVRKTETYNYLVEDLAVDGEQSFGLEIYAPTSNIGQVEMTGTVTLTASLAT